MRYQTVRLILGDQLNSEHSWFNEVSSDVLYLIAELKQENTYVTHHIQKTCAFFAAMAQFAQERREDGHHVVYLTLDDTEPFADLPSLIAFYCDKVSARKFEFQRPDEYRLLEQLSNLSLSGVVTGCVDSEHFLLPFEEIESSFPNNKHIVMEHFYRRMRKRFDLLMADGKPLGGKWNFDADNRKKLSAKDLENVPSPLMFSSSTLAIQDRLKKHKIETIGKCEEQLLWPINRSQSLSLLAHFCQVCLPLFGRFQDAMTGNHQAKWSLYHSRLSFSLNSKLLNPLEVINAAIDSYRQNPDIDIAQVEGFVRQILGWREYIRGIYWGNMPEYANKNVLNARNKLPDYFWNGDTKMNCVSQAISQSLDYAYAHHIQRLMVTGNFCLLTEVEPKEVEEWYLGIYVDALEWVEMPNTKGMALFSHGGIVATKPYAASGAYINRMSDYCKSCHYSVKEKVTDNACPFNSLYWRFMHKHREQLARNPRVGMIYRNWDRLSDEEQKAILARSDRYLAQLETL
ncbi:cryptochrome/photolyase family protein [Vibrio sonorensis]|uniref:cryptochrome/photolyase family protein n=1 Tax=Vibrio sonorensis TaxID=1004316 RepID=UPI0008D9FE63|nr:cryptochrome/photolyase family protein [Vibrio sonorensis]